MFENVQQQSSSSLIAPQESIKRERWQKHSLWLSAIRADGRGLFEKMGLPNLRQEEWKYTDVSGLGKQTFSSPTPLAHPLPGSVLQDMLFSRPLSPLRLVFVNGFYSPSLSQAAGLPAGVEIGSLGETLNRNHPLLEKHLAAYAKPEENSFVALNNAFIEDGAFVYIPEGIRLNHPVHLVYISTKSSKNKDDKPGAHHPRNLVIAEKGAAVTLIEDYVGNSSSPYLNNPVTEIVVDDSAEVDHYKLQRESKEALHIATIEVLQGKGSHFSSNSVTFGGLLTRNNIHSYLAGTGSSCTFNGLFIIKDTQHVDNHTLIRHSAPDCRSSELYHGILDDRARGVFNGKIYVEADARKTDSQQTSRSLMLSNDSRVDTKPQLEIFADDVKCNHGATVGQIDTNALYYLRSRGVAAADARKMLTLGFGQQVTSRFKLEPLREAVESFLANRLEEW